MRKFWKTGLAVLAAGSILAAGCQEEKEIGTGAVVGNEHKVLMAEETNMLTLNPDEQKLYDEYKKNYNDSLLKDADPIMVAKLYIHAVITGDHETQYELYIDSPEQGPDFSKEAFLKEAEQDGKKTAAAFKKMFANVKSVKFVEVDAGSGYVEFLMEGEETGQLQMGKDSHGVWKMKVQPSQ
jgi:hypothetical protein